MNVFWEQFKNTPAHYVRQYVIDIEKSKFHFKGLNKGDSQRYALAAQAASIPIN